MLYFNQSDYIYRTKSYFILFFPNPYIIHKRPIINTNTATISLKLLVAKYRL
jgi:hypothetical protein